MMAKKKGKVWGEAEKLPFCTDTAIDYGHPTLSPDGTKLVFVMDGPYGKGKHDLFLSTYVKRSRTWSDPVNLGDAINTPSEELFPYFYNDTTLYFASDGHIGLGGLDIFVSYGGGTTWTKPKHLGYPLNSGGDDFGITLNEGGESGYFSSNRVKSRLDDIYSFSMTPLVFTLSGVVTDSASHKPIANAKVILINLKTKAKQEVTVDASGKYQYKLDKETDYEVYAEKRGYFASKSYIKSTKGFEYSADLIQDLVLAPPTVVLRGVFYDIDKWDLRPESVKTLDSVVEVLNTYPYIVVELGSHTDCRASEAHNDTLSQRRSESVVNYLIQHGIDKERLVAKGYGEHQLVNNCGCNLHDNDTGIHCTEEEHQANRRTTLTVLRWDYVPKKP